MSALFESLYSVPNFVSRLGRHVRPFRVSVPFFTLASRWDSDACPPSSDLCAFNSLHLSPSQGSDVPTFRLFALCTLNSLHLSPRFGRDVRPFRISVLSILYMCLPAWIVLFALFGSLCFQIWVLISAPFGSLCSQVFICMRLAPRMIVMSALVCLHVPLRWGSDVR